MFWRQASRRPPCWNFRTRASEAEIRGWFAGGKPFPSCKPTADSLLSYLWALEKNEAFMRKTTLLCIKHSVIHASAPQGWLHVYISAPVRGLLEPPERTVLSDVLCLGVSIKEPDEPEPYADLAACHLHHLSWPPLCFGWARCLWKMAFTFWIQLRTALHSWRLEHIHTHVWETTADCSMQKMLMFQQRKY